MILVKYGNRVKIKWLSGEVSIKDTISLIIYRQAQPIIRKFGFIRKRCFTVLIDLTTLPEEIFSSFSSTTKNEIRKTDKKGETTIAQETDIGKYMSFYNRFAKAAGLTTISHSEMELFGDNLYITKTVYNQQIITMHCYLEDRPLGRARLFTSSRNFDPVGISSNEISCINRWHHWEDIKLFKSRDFQAYDFGGYAYGTTDSKMDNINKFKTGFSKNIIEQSNYYSLPLYLLYKIRRRKIS